MERGNERGRGTGAAAGLLYLNGLLFAAFGLGFVFAPALFAGLLTGSVPGSSSALTDMRATYGGVALALGLWFALQACVPARHRVGLELLGLVAVLLAAARGYGMVVDGGPNAFMFAFLAAEVLVGVLAIGVHRRMRWA